MDLEDNLDPDGREIPEIFKHLIGKTDLKYEMFGPLSAEETGLWNELMTKFTELNRLKSEVESLRRFFWATIERNRAVYDKRFHVDEKTGMLMTIVEA